MTPTRQPKHPALREVYWREEILEVVLWLRGEGYDEHLTPGVLRRFLGLHRDEGTEHLERLTAQGYLRQADDGRFELTEQGEEEAQRLVEVARSVPAPSPGACGPECWCDSSPAEASKCADHRVQ